MINRLRPPGDGDILVPGGTVSILGTSSVTIPDPDDRDPTIAEVDRILDGHDVQRLVADLQQARIERRRLPRAGRRGEDHARAAEELEHRLGQRRRARDLERLFGQVDAGGTDRVVAAGKIGEIALAAAQNVRASIRQILKKIDFGRIFIIGSML